MNYLKYIDHALIFVTILIAYLAYLIITSRTNPNNLPHFEENQENNRNIKYYKDRISIELTNNHVIKSPQLRKFEIEREKNNDLQNEVRLEVKNKNENEINNSNNNIIFNKKEKKQNNICNKFNIYIQKFFGSIFNFLRTSNDKFLLKFICKSQFKRNNFIDLSEISYPKEEEGCLVKNENDIENNSILSCQDNFIDNKNNYNNNDIIKEDISMNNKYFQQANENNTNFYSPEKRKKITKDNSNSILGFELQQKNNNKSNPSFLKENQSPNKINK
jgi:hypothetical protein